MDWLVQETLFMEQLTTEKGGTIGEQEVDILAAQQKSDMHQSVTVEGEGLFLSTKMQLSTT